MWKNIDFFKVNFVALLWNTHLLQDQIFASFHSSLLSYFFKCILCPQTLLLEDERQPLYLLQRVTVICEEWLWAQHLPHGRVSREHWKQRCIDRQTCQHGRVQLCAGLCVCVCLGDGGVPVNELLFERFLCRSMANKLNLHFRILLPLCFSKSVYFPFTFSSLLSERQACSSHYLPISFCDLCSCSCLVFFSSSLLCLLCLPKFSTKFSISFPLILHFLTS